MIGIVVAFGIVQTLGLLLLLAALRSGARADAALAQPRPSQSATRADNGASRLRRLA